MLFRGRYDRDGYAVTCDDTILPLFHRYSVERIWHHEPARKQLALDIMVMVFGEPIAQNLFRPPDKGHDYYSDYSSAWLPHLHYLPTLWNLVSPQAYGIWELTSAQVWIWIEDWAEQLHFSMSNDRYRSYRPLFRQDWNEVFEQVLDSLEVYPFERKTMTPPIRLKYYVAGYSPEDIALQWSKNKIAQLRGQIVQERSNGR